ncbi:bifunctional tRNA pseudouridine(32) synthase/23S rRNA pseudouridine(746) synthase RluA [Wohlfahrtiimonas populi]|uniref:bifunctional tRNA pseudouridine(32) synthase/23S rRNA pseudouridine(746) synthase RluA n=1 Tax=Wohlfahrtiimonas populi TaxID=1940240 RepID=UPI00098D44D7|nr:bifunctional tRNA pseudouridine(32) synthase/23S rRNA pseudouridine(746) synthase RluA [Wohlfahrtiimonas populi]
MDYYYDPAISPWLDVLYQDKDIMVVNKPHDLLSVPGKPAELWDSILTRVQWEFPDAETVHRLDLATSGLMVVVLHIEAERELKRQFRERETDKKYIAKVFGILEQKEGSIDFPLICDWPNRPKQMVSYEYGKDALTHYKVLNEDDEGNTLIELIPVTGRSHQLRVHMMSIGHPILGDRFYAHDEALKGKDRLYLHAAELAFTHPMTKKRQLFQQPPNFS